MKAEELKTKTPDELQKMLLDLRKDQFNMRFQRSQGALENTSELRKSRRTIARVKTFLNQPAAAVAPKKAAKPVKAKEEKAEKPKAEKKAPAKKAPAKKTTAKAKKETKEKKDA